MPDEAAAPEAVVEEVVRGPQRGQAAQRGSGTRGAAEEVLFACEGGVLTFYESSGNFAATCDNPAHGRCILTRTSKASERSNRRGQGRPLGYLAAWLATNDQDTREEHRAFMPAIEERRRLRQEYSASVAFKALESSERPPRAGEEEEPESVP